MAQEAQRLAALGLTPYAISKRLKVNPSTVTRWARAGKLTPEDGVMPATGITTARAPMTPEEWARTVRRSYQLDATDDQLVTFAQSMLALSLDASVTATIRMSAGREFRSTVKQLAFKTPLPDEQPKPEETRRPVAAPRATRNGVDPRSVLQAVK